MNRENITWFGFRLTQKQSVNIFILSVIGVVFSAFFLLMMVYPMIMSFMYYDPYYPPSGGYFFSMLLTMLAPILLFVVIFILSVYSLNRSRKIAKFYSPLVDPVIEPKPIPRYSDIQHSDIAQYCPNCGSIRKAHQRFCTNCGHQTG
jgi:hypothetical protein